MTDQDVWCDVCGNAIEEQANGWANGHNASPIVPDGRCCDSCNVDVVVARVQALLSARLKEEHDRER
jgi:hypothetical protein